MLLAPKFRFITREPLVRFLALGALIFVVAHVIARERESAARQIVVDDRIERRLASVNEAQYGVPPNAEALQRLLASYVDDEVLYREALRMGLDRDDEIIRRRLIQKMQFLQHDLASASPPDEPQLRAYYNSHPTLFLSPESVSFEQIFFSADHGGSAAAQARAQRTRVQLTNEGASHSGARNDEFPVSIPVEPITRDDATGLFGSTAIVDALFTTPEGQWSPPVRSGYGWHLVKVSHRQPPNRLPFESVEDQVRADYMTERTRGAEQRELEALRSHFEVVRLGKPAPRSS
jgi:hypothetical protein